MGVLLREISVALDLVLFDEAAEHEDGRSVVLLHHSPKIVKTVGERPLGGYCCLTLKFDRIGVDVVLHFLVLSVWCDVYS